MRPIHVHVHRAPARDARPADLYEDLARRMAGALRELLARTHDEWKEDLHPRRSDGKFGTGEVQHAEAAPEKPTQATAKGGMDKIRELLGSGHAFTKAELLAATGLTEKRLSDYLAMLKNPKWAGAKGALQIARKPDGSFFVATADGAPAPPAPKPEVPVQSAVPTEGQLTVRVASLRARLFEIGTAQWRSDARADAQRRINGVASYLAGGFGADEDKRASMGRSLDEAETSLKKAEGEYAVWKREQDAKAAAFAKAKEAEAEAKAREGMTRLDTSQDWQPKATSKAVAAELLRRGYVDHSDFGRVEVGIANDMAQSLHDHLREFPALRAQVNFVGSIQAHAPWYVEKAAQKLVERMRGAMNVEQATKHIMKPKAPGRAWAVAWGGAGGWEGTRGVGMNEKYGSAKAAPALKPDLQSSVNTRWHPVGCDTIKSIMDHELGHTLDGLLGLRGNPEIKRLRKEAYGGEAAHAARTPYESTEVPIGPNATANMTNNVSKYAATNGAEFIAEAWSEYRNNPNPRPIAKAVGDLIRSEYAKKFPHPSAA